MPIDYRSLEAGEILFHEGDDSDAVFIIESGKVAITKAEPNGKSVVLATLGATQMFGEMGVIEEMPRNATARATELCRLKVFPKSDFAEWVKHEPNAALRVMKTLAHRLREANSVIARQRSALEEIPTERAVG